MMEKGFVVAEKDGFLAYLNLILTYPDSDQFNRRG
jgi:hypothetical protein